MKENYYTISKEKALRAGLTPKLRAEIEGELIVSDKDLRNITLTIDERAKGLGAVEYIEPEKENK